MIQRIADPANRVTDSISATIEDFLRSHADKLDSYPVRGVVMYGLAECERGRQCAELLRNERMEELGRLMDLSHDGDRIVSWNQAERSNRPPNRDESTTADQGEQSIPAVADYSDAAMQRLIDDARSGSPDAELAYQPGAYSCSTPEIDRMVDIARSHKDALGAQILGAGLGGCISVLIPKGAYADLEQRMIRDYYNPQNREPEMFPCRPVAGSRVVLF